ncbi:YpoC family protein [Neobacillus sp. KR4-4]|uniref:YpoC family protein n=1 Tax=Neobacillus sp. KR4-4 TaxID=3344872 RepID=UPI0035CA5663
MDKREVEISNLLTEWKNSKMQLEVLFREREYKNTKLLMDKGIQLFIQFLAWSNDLPVALNESLNLKQLEFKPVNVEERLAFITSRPALYHSYRQLSELMMEQEKLFVKRNLLKKASKPNG